MILNLPCPSCCQQCRTTSPASLGVGPNDHFAIQNFLPAGSLTFEVREHWWPDSACGHVHLDDDWHDFVHAHVFESLGNPDRDQRAVDQLKKLVEHQFIRVRCRLSSNLRVLFLRIYIIPYDLPGVHGSLRQRDEAVLAYARPILRDLLSRVSRCPHEWKAEACPSHNCIPPGIWDTVPDNRTLADIYGDLDSPSQILGSCSAGVRSTKKIYGLESKLYGYQRETVTAMLQRETANITVLDPLYVPLTGHHGKTFFIQPSTLEILRECPQTSRPRGGILCEELGTGKTVMALALILSTLDELSSPEPSLSNPIVLTPLSFRYFPGALYDAERKRAGWRRQASFPSLLEMMLHTMQVRPDKTQRYRSTTSLRPGLAKALRLNAPFYLQYCDVVRRARGKVEDLGPRVVYLTTATLVIVPPNLVAQWVSEIHKHVSSEISFLIVKDHDELPSVLEMASDYDIVLMSHTRFAREEKRFKPQALHSWTLCNCPCLPGLRIPICSCTDRKDVSPLAQIRWKRLVVDEGHVHGVADTRISVLASKLNVERRWLISGTPTRSLLGLNLGLRSEPDESEEPTIFENDGPPGDRDDDSAVFSQLSNLAATVDLNSSWARIWTRADREDLHRLHTMIASFLKDERFMADHQIFRTHVMKSLCHASGPQPGSTLVLSQLMNNVMIRHRIADIEREITLPALCEETVVLDMDPMAVKSYNALQALIVINAVDSQRVDQDYLFHKNNVSRLRDLADNMSQLMFWRVDEDRYYIDERSSDTDSMLKHAIERGVLASDLELLKQAVRHILIAKEDKIWADVQNISIPEMPYDIEGIPSSVLRAWTEIENNTPKDAVTPIQGLMFPYRLSKLTALVTARPLITLESLVDEGHAQAKEDQERIKMFDELAGGKTRSGRRSLKSASGEKTSRQAVKTHEAAKAAEAPEKISEFRREMNATLEWASNVKDCDRQSMAINATIANASSGDRKDMLRSSVLSKARILRSRSSKLNFILTEVLEFSREEKFLIFSKSPLTLAHVADALNLARVKYISYTSEMKVENRQQAVVTFETSDTYRVFLMELKHGARGLNLVSASRIIFCEPVWQADVEAQAIKRAHRIGQKRPISVKTLVIRGTPEELIVSRRTELKDSRQKQTAHFSEDDGVRRFIEHPIFIEENSYRPLDVNISLLDIDDRATEVKPSELPRKRVNSARRRPAIAFEDEREHPRSSGCKPIDDYDSLQPLKRRRLRFSDDSISYYCLYDDLPV